MEKQDLILFDWDGVVFNTREVMERIYLNLAKLGFTREAVKEMYDSVRGNYSDAHLAEALVSKYKKPLADVLDAILASYENVSNFVFPDAAACLGRSHGKKILGVLTAGNREHQEWKIVGSKVHHLFEFIVTVPGNTFVQSKVEKIIGLLSQYEHVTFLDDTFATIQAVSEMCGDNKRLAIFWVNRLGASNALPRGVMEIHSLAEFEP